MTPRRAPLSASAFSDARYDEGMCPTLADVESSAGSWPTVASSMIARSVMLRAIGPPMSWVLESGTMPVRLDSPRVPRRPTRLFSEAGLRIDPQVSLPMPAAAKLAETEAPVPPLDPPGLRSRSYGFFTCPKPEPIEVIPAANSCMLVLARITAPAALSRWTRKASRFGWNVASASDPGGALSIKGICRCARLRVDRLDRVERGSLLVVLTNPRQVHVDELPRR